MLTELEKFIFPDTCEVIKLTASQEFVFPIFKNGRSSLRRSGTLVPMDAISDIRDPIIVFLRDPRERFLSGVNTFVQHLQQSDPSLDTHTILYFVQNYLFLNRHYAPQFFWLIHLAQHIDSKTKIILKDFEDVGNYVTIHHNAGIEHMHPEVEASIKSFNKDKLDLYYYLDEVLIQRLGGVFTVRELLQDVKNNQPELYELVFGPTQRLHSVLP